MGGSSTWSSIKRRHHLESTWLHKREKTLKVLSQKLQSPEPTKKSVDDDPVIKPYVRPKTAQAIYRPSSSEGVDSSFFKTEVNDYEVTNLTLKRDANMSIHIRRRLSSTGPEFLNLTVKQRLSNTEQKIPRASSSKREKSRPPPSFFAKAADAVKAKYAIRKKILEGPNHYVKNTKEELKANIFKVMTARAEERAKRLTPSRHNLFRRA